MIWTFSYIFLGFIYFNLNSQFQVFKKSLFGKLISIVEELFDINFNPLLSIHFQSYEATLSTMKSGFLLLKVFVTGQFSIKSANFIDFFASKTLKNI